MAEQIKETPIETATEPKVVEEKKTVKKTAVEPTKKINQLVDEVVKGLHGTGRERMLSLGEHYEAVQHEVNQLIKKGEIR